MMLYIYHLQRFAGQAAGESHAAIVIAPSTDAARTIASTRAHDEGWQVWLDPEATSCVVVGTANEEEVPGHVLRAFTPR